MKRTFLWKFYSSIRRRLGAMERRESGRRRGGS